MTKAFALLVICVTFIVVILTGCRDEYEEARQKCALDNPMTVDYLKCKAIVDAQEQEDNDDAALVASQTAVMASVATMQ